MTFWTSKEPGVLPKWVFWLSFAVLCVELILVFNAPTDEISAGTIAGILAATMYTILARINAIQVLFVLAVLGFAFLIVGAVILFLANRQQDGFGIFWLLMLGWMALSGWWVWYLNLYRLKPIKMGDSRKSREIAEMHEAELKKIKLALMPEQYCVARTAVSVALQSLAKTLQGFDELPETDRNHLQGQLLTHYTNLRQRALVQGASGYEDADWAAAAACESWVQTRIFCGPADLLRVEYLIGDLIDSNVEQTSTHDDVPVPELSDTKVDAQPSNDDYEIELNLFEKGEIDKSLCAKHLVEARGNEEEAKWLYVKDRVTTAPSRRAEREKLQRATVAEQERIREEKEAARVAEQEALERAERAKKDEARRVQVEAARKKRGEELARGNRQFIGTLIVITALFIFLVF